MRKIFNLNMSVRVFNDALFFYKMIWFFELVTNSLCGKTMALRTTTSPGIETLLPARKERKLGPWASQSRGKLNFLPITVIDGWSFPSWKRESCSILENCLFGSGSAVRWEKKFFLRGNQRFEERNSKSNVKFYHLAFLRRDSKVQ